ncbi:pantoate--beta-alanine ligase [Bradyrhizobium sp. BR 1433]|uniref:pantoate--beta-alanine ligase n=1 Tax=Bradyrhizobium sp. BR 1433 TaxID=3447967 RepID=UPI003EE5EA0F
MGCLPDGHLVLVEAGCAQCDLAGVGVFVNPMQFGPNEDVSSFLRDRKLCRDAGGAIVVAPDVQAIHPSQFENLHRAWQAREATMRQGAACVGSLQLLDNGAKSIQVEEWIEWKLLAWRWSSAFIELVS